MSEDIVGFIFACVVCVVACLIVRSCSIDEIHTEAVDAGAAVYRVHLDEHNKAKRELFWITPEGEVEAYYGD